MQKTLWKIGLTAVPAVVAGLAVWLEPALTIWFKGRPSALPLSLLLLLAALLNPRLRHLLLVTLNFGVAFLAWRDMQHGGHLPLPAAYDYDTLQALRSAALTLVAVLSAVSGVAEVWHPGTVWARRCYFGAASLYFCGQGMLGVLVYFTWQSLVLLFTGLTAFVACVAADRVVASESEEVFTETFVSDEILQQARETAHRAALQAKEWRETFVAVIEENTEPGVTPPLPH